MIYSLIIQYKIYWDNFDKGFSPQYTLKRHSIKAHIILRNIGRCLKCRTELWCTLSFILFGN